VNGWWRDILGALLAWILAFWLATPLFGELYEVEPVRPMRGGMLEELRERLSARDAAFYGDSSDVVTRGHYLGHAINSAIRNRHGGTGKVNASYLPGGSALVLPEPNVSLSEVRRRGIGGRVMLAWSEWDRQPLYLLDELSAYVCGAVAGLENGSRRRARESIGFAREVHSYALTMARLARQRGYRHADELDAFLERAGEYVEQITFECLEPPAE